MNCCLKKAWGCVTSLIVLLLVLYLGFTFFVVPTVINRLEQTVRDEFALDSSSVVSIRQGGPLNAVQGRFDFLMLKADSATIDGLAVEDLLLRSDDVKVDVWKSLAGKEAVITGMGDSFIEFSVSEQALVERWAPELAKKNLSDPELTLDEGLATVAATFSLGPLKPRVTVSGKIEATDDGQVRFSASNVGIAGADINLSAIKTAFKTLDPVVDFGQLQLDVNISKVVVQDGYLYVAADSNFTPSAEQPGEPSDDLDSEGGLLERFKQISLVDHQERVEQLEQLYGELKQRGVSTAEQVQEFANKHLSGWQDDYRWLLKELDQVVESQLSALDDKDGKQVESQETESEQAPASEE